MKIDLDVLHTGTVRQLIDLALEAVDEGEPNIVWLVSGAVTIKVTDDHPEVASELWDCAHRKVANIGRAIEVLRELQALYPEPGA